MAKLFKEICFTEQPREGYNPFPLPHTPLHQIGLHIQQKKISHVLVWKFQVKMGSSKSRNKTWRMSGPN